MQYIKLDTDLKSFINNNQRSFPPEAIDDIEKLLAKHEDEINNNKLTNFWEDCKDYFWATNVDRRSDVGGKIIDAIVLMLIEKLGDEEFLRGFNNHIPASLFYMSSLSGEIIIPEFITVIENEAFADSKIKKITILNPDIDFWDECLGGKSDIDFKNISLEEFYDKYVGVQLEEWDGNMEYNHCTFHFSDGNSVEINTYYD